jgi:hypothetical protein
MSDLIIPISAQPEETEELTIVSLDDYKFGLDSAYVDSKGLNQLSTFLIGYRPADGLYYVVEKPRGFTRPELPQTDAVIEGIYNEEIAGAYAASGSAFFNINRVFDNLSGITYKIPCKKYNEPSLHLGGEYHDSTVRNAVERWNAHYDPAPNGLSNTLIYSYIAIDNRSLKPSGGGSGVGRQGYQGFQGDQGHQGEDGAAVDRGFQGFQGIQGYQGYVGAIGDQGAQGYQGCSACMEATPLNNLVCWSGSAAINNCGSGFTGIPSVHLVPAPSDPLYSCVGTKTFAMQALTGFGTGYEGSFSCFPSECSSISGYLVVTGAATTGEICFFTKGYTPQIVFSGGTGSGATQAEASSWCDSTTTHYGQLIAISGGDVDQCFPDGTQLCINGKEEFNIGEKCGSNYIVPSISGHSLDDTVAVCQGSCPTEGHQGYQGYQGFQGLGYQGYQGSQGCPNCFDVTGYTYSNNGGRSAFYISGFDNHQACFSDSLFPPEDTASGLATLTYTSKSGLVVTASVKKTQHYAGGLTTFTTTNNYPIPEYDDPTSPKFPDGSGATICIGPLGAQGFQGYQGYQGLKRCIYYDTMEGHVAADRNRLYPPDGGGEPQDFINWFSGEPVCIQGINNTEESGRVNIQGRAISGASNDAFGTPAIYFAADVGNLADLIYGGADGPGITICRGNCSDQGNQGYQGYQGVQGYQGYQGCNPCLDVSMATSESGVTSGALSGTTVYTIDSPQAQCFSENQFITVQGLPPFAPLGPEVIVHTNISAFVAATSDQGVVGDVSLTNSGSGYKSTPTVSVVGNPNLPISNINVVSGGSGYIATPTVTISGGGGTDLHRAIRTTRFSGLPRLSRSFRMC